MKLAWATDIHLDHATESACRQFCQAANEQADALVFTGDIAESNILGTALTALAEQTGHRRHTHTADPRGNLVSWPAIDDFLSFFCKAVGDVLLETARSHPGCEIPVLCRHTHGGELQVLENLRVVTGPAEYGRPQIQQVLRSVAGISFKEANQSTASLV